MSADLLRRAADEMRDEDDAFHVAVADWLDATAEARELAVALGMGEPDRALAVARAYLGESS